MQWPLALPLCLFRLGAGPISKGIFYFVPVLMRVPYMLPSPVPQQDSDLQSGLLLRVVGHVSCTPFCQSQCCLCRPTPYLSLYLVVLSVPAPFSCILTIAFGVGLVCQRWRALETYIMFVEKGSTSGFPPSNFVSSLRLCICFELVSVVPSFVLLL